MDEMHPNGRCTCGGGGSCDWCVRTDRELEKQYNVNLTDEQAQLIRYMEGLSEKYFGSRWEPNLEHLLWAWTHDDGAGLVDVPSKIDDMEVDLLTEISTLAGGWACVPAAGTQSAEVSLYGEFVPFLTLTAEIIDKACSHCKSPTQVVYKTLMTKMRHCFRCNRAQIQLAMPLRYIQLDLGTMSMLPPPSCDCGAGSGAGMHSHACAIYGEGGLEPPEYEPREK